MLFLWYFLWIFWSDSNKDDDDDDVRHVTVVNFFLSTCNSCVLDGPSRTQLLHVDRKKLTTVTKTGSGNELATYNIRVANSVIATDT